MKAVLFDVYETLLTGPRLRDREGLLRSVVADFGMTFPPDRSLVECLDQEITAEHRRSDAIHPEVDIREIWQRIFSDLNNTEAFALAAEDAIHPVTAINQAEDTLLDLHRQGVRLGIISNAQSYTRTLLKRHFPRAWETFDSDLLFFSYEHRIAKPDSLLFRMAVDRLATGGIHPHQILMVGDSEKNDIKPAKALRLNTHLFQGGRLNLPL